MSFASCANHVEHVEGVDVVVVGVPVEETSKGAAVGE
jgi:hypothetical protein